MKRHDLSFLCPVGRDWRSMRQLYLIPLVLLLVLSFLVFLGIYDNTRSLLVHQDGDWAVTTAVLGHDLPYGHKMPPFRMMGRIVLAPLPYMAASLLIGGVASNYRFCRSGSRSDYTMRRLPDPWEYHRRCWALPLLSCVLYLLAFAALYAISFSIYHFATPKALLAPTLWQQFWG